MTFFNYEFYYQIFITSLISAFVGTIFGFFLPRYFEMKRERIERILDIYDEYASPYFSEHRRKAFNLMKRYPDAKWPEFRSIDQEGSISLDAIMRFYLRIQILVKHNKIDKNLTIELFANNFYEYYYGIFNKSIPKEWEAAKRLDDLAKWFERELSEARHQYLYDHFS